MGSNILFQLLVMTTLYAPPDSPILVPPQAIHTIRKIATNMELTCDRESGWRNQYQREIDLEQFKNEVNLYRGRFQELKGVPSVQDVDCFPFTTEQIDQMLSFNRAYLKYVQLNLALWPSTYAARHDWWDDARKETEQLYIIYGLLKGAKVSYYTTYVRRLALKQLVERIGQEAYWNRQLPPCVPLWRFERI